MNDLKALSITSIIEFWLFLIKSFIYLKSYMKMINKVNPMPVICFNIQFNIKTYLPEGIPGEP